MTINLSDYVKNPDLLKEAQKNSEAGQEICPECQHPMIAKGFTLQCVECGHEEYNIPSEVEAQYGF